MVGVCENTLALVTLREKWRYARKMFDSPEESNKSMLDLLDKTMDDDEWWVILTFVFKVAFWIEVKRSFGTGCRCHEALLKLGKQIDCQEKGRRLKDLGPFLEVTWTECVREPNSWDLQRDFQGREYLMLHAVNTCFHSRAWAREVQICR